MFFEVVLGIETNVLCRLVENTPSFTLISASTAVSSVILKAMLKKAEHYNCSQVFCLICKLVVINKELIFNKIILMQ